MTEDKMNEIRDNRISELMRYKLKPKKGILPGQIVFNPYCLAKIINIYRHINSKNPEMIND